MLKTAEKGLCLGRHKIARQKPVLGRTIPFRKKNCNKKFLGGVIFIWWVNSFERLVVPSLKIVINLHRTYRSYPVKKNHIGSVVSEILRYSQEKNTLYNGRKLILVLLAWAFWYLCMKEQCSYFHLYIIMFKVWPFTLTLHPCLF